MRIQEIFRRDINWRVHGKTVLRYGVIVLAILYALEMGWVRPQNRYRGISESKASGLAAITEYPQYESQGSYYAASFAEPDNGDVDKEQPADRKMVRSATLNLTVAKPTESAERVQQITQQFGGYVVKADLTGNGEYESASLQIRVPAAKYEAVRKSLRSLALSVGSEEVTSDDVTKQYVDSGASLRSLRAEEDQYLTILKRAGSVKEVLEVTEKLSGVRREIDKTEAEFKSLSQEVQMCLITVYLHRDAQFKALAIQWQPWNEIKFATRSGLESMAAYVNSIITFAFHLPSILLWVVTVIAGIALSWRALKWALRIAFGGKEAHT